MEKSERFGFNLPSRSAEDIADIDKISDNFRIIDGEMVTKEDINEAISTKANLEFVNLEIEELAYVSGLKEGAHIYELKEIIEAGSSGAYELYFTDGTQLITSAHDSFKVGKKYLISTTLDPEKGYIFDIVAEVIDLKDKVNIEDIDQTYSPTSPNAQSGIAVAEALSNVGGGGSKPIKLLSTTVTQEAVDEAGEAGIRTVSVGDENLNLAPYSEILFRLDVPKNELNTDAGVLVIRLTDTPTPTTVSGAYLLKTQSTSISTACGISTSLASVFVVKALFDNDTFIYGEVLKNGYGNSDGYAGVANGWTCAHATFKKSTKKYIHIGGAGYKFPAGTTVEVYVR